jgi:hypothetical protein
MLLAENSASLLPNLSAHRSTAFRLTAAAILDDGPNHSTGGRSHNHPFPFGQRDTEIPIIRFNCSPGRPCLPPLGSFGAFHAPRRRNCVRPPHSHTCRSSSFVRRILASPFIPAYSLRWVRLAQFTSLIAQIGLGRSKARDALRLLRLDQNREKPSCIFYILTFLSIC